MGKIENMAVLLAPEAISAFENGRLQEAYDHHLAAVGSSNALDMDRFAELVVEKNIAWCDFAALPMEFASSMSFAEKQAAFAALSWANDNSAAAVFMAKAWGDPGDVEEAKRLRSDHLALGYLHPDTALARDALMDKLNQKVREAKERNAEKPVVVPSEASEVRVVEAEIVDELFESGTLPAIHSPLEGLFVMRNASKESIEAAASLVKSVDGGVFPYFARGAEHTHGVSTVAMAKLFDAEAATRALDADFWGRALGLTDVMSYLPAKRRNEWREMIRTGFSKKEVVKQDRFGWNNKKEELVPIPAFERDTVINTLASLIESRQRFFAERIDGLWDSLSEEHLTNVPSAFQKRMILRRVINHYGHLDHDMAYYIHDLRAVLAKFAGRDEPDARLTIGSLDSIVRDVMRSNGSGKWYEFDGCWKIRMYKVGTAHLQVAPEMALRLNAMLASIRPMAIPPEFRAKKKTAKDRKAFSTVHDLIPFEVLNELRELSCNRTNMNQLNATHEMSKRTEAILRYLGGVKSGKMYATWTFEYVIDEVIAELLRSGRVPEQKAFQYYPTPENLAEELVEMAEITEACSVLEPSAGQGGLADFLPKDRTVCVELSELHAKVLEAKGFNTVHADFLAWHPEKPFDRIVMNPPFSGGRAIDHVQKAASHLKPGGILCAVLPSGLRGKTIVEGRHHEYSTVRDGEFKGASVSVVLLKLS